MLHPFFKIAKSCQTQEPAILTSDGDIASPNWDRAGWEGTKITGTISSLIVQDSVLSGCPNGAAFSLFLCKWPDAADDVKKEESTVNIYPNPTSREINILISEILSNGSLKIMNITGETILQQEGLNGMSFS